MTDSVAALREQLLQLQSQHASGALDAAPYDKARAALERRVLDRVLAGDAAATQPPPQGRPNLGLFAAVGGASLLIALLGYAWTGSPSALLGSSVGSSVGAAGQPTASAANPGQPPALDAAQISALAAKLAARLKESPNDPVGWSMLGRAYMLLEKPADAVAAYARAIQLAPDDANTLADYADALGVQNGRNLAGEPTRLIERALRADPGNLKALMLAGTAAFNRDDFAVAVKHWDRMAQLGPADNPMVMSAAEGAAEARKRGALPPAELPSKTAGNNLGSKSPDAVTPPSTATAPTVQSAAPAAATAKASSLSGTVSLAPALASKVAPEDTVFIFARAAEGSRMPLAILRKQVKDLPFAFTLDDSLSMSPAAKLSGAARVVVSARISKSGQAQPQSGDLEAVSEPLKPGSRGIQLEIARSLP